MRASKLTTDTPASAGVSAHGRRVRLDSEVEKQITALGEFDLAGVRWAWREAHGRDAPQGLNRDFLMRCLAHRLQVRAHGDLDRKSKRVLDRVAGGDLSVIAASVGPGMNLKPGTVLVREYKGELHHATVLAKGYAWHDQIYPTLSAVARAITRCNWNGYVFFGLKTKSSKRGDSDG